MAPLCVPLCVPLYGGDDCMRCRDVLRGVRGVRGGGWICSSKQPCWRACISIVSLSLQCFFLRVLVLYTTTFQKLTKFSMEREDGGPTFFFFLFVQLFLCCGMWEKKEQREEFEFLWSLVLFFHFSTTYFFCFCVLGLSKKTRPTVQYRLNNKKSISKNNVEHFILHFKRLFENKERKKKKLSPPPYHRSTSSSFFWCDTRQSGITPDIRHHISHNKKKRSPNRTINWTKRILLCWIDHNWIDDNNTTLPRQLLLWNSTSTRHHQGSTHNQS